MSGWDILIGLFLAAWVGVLLYGTYEAADEDERDR